MKQPGHRATVKAANPTDRHVGVRVRMRRIMLKMSQTELGNALGVTFQQVQKYEKGTNRIGASRLHRIAQVLQVPESFFFEGAPNAPQAGFAEPAGPDYVSDFLASADGLALIRAFIRVDNAGVRRSIVALAEQLAALDD